MSSLDAAASTVPAATVVGDPQAVATLSAPISGFPTIGSNYLVISTGVATELPGEPATIRTTDLPEAAPGADNNDLTQVRLTLNPAPSATCVAFDFAFLSEEFPEYVGSTFNDIFTAELNESQFTLNGNQVDVPNNFAYDSQGNPVSINTVFGMAEVPGTAMDGSTPALRAASPVKKKSDGSMDLILSVQDVGDSVLDSAVMIDNLRWLSDPNCAEGVVVIDQGGGNPGSGNPGGGNPGGGNPGGGNPGGGNPGGGNPGSGNPGSGNPGGGNSGGNIPGGGNPSGSSRGGDNSGSGNAGGGNQEVALIDPGLGGAPTDPDHGSGGLGSGSGSGSGSGGSDGSRGNGSQDSSDGGQVERAYLATLVPSPADVFGDPVQLLLSVLLAALLVLLVAFPAQLFNSTFDKNREEINGWFRWIPGPSRLNLPSWVHIGVLGLVAAVLLLMTVVPDAGFNKATLAQAIGYLIAIPLVVLILELSGGFYSRWKRSGSMRPEPRGRREPQWRVVPSALIVAGLLALLSRLADFSPPYVYGLIAVYIGTDRALRNLNETEKREERGRRTLIGVLCLAAASAVSWLAWNWLDQDFGQGVAGFGWLTLDAFLATLFLLGLETAVFGLIPLAFLKGEQVWQWKRAVWVAIFVPIAFFFINVRFVAGEAEALTLTQIVRTVAAFVAFGIFSFLFWGYFHPRLRRRSSHSAVR